MAELQPRGGAKNKENDNFSLMSKQFLEMGCLTFAAYVPSDKAAGWLKYSNLQISE